MNWYYFDGTNQIGPIAEADLLSARQAGVITDSTLVWREGLANWIPFREALPGAAGPAPQAVPPLAGAGEGQAQCCECRGYFPAGEMIRHGQFHVCAACKPVFLQKLGEGIAPRSVQGRRALPVDAEQLTQEILARGYPFSIGNCLNRGINAVKARYGVCLGATVLIMLCNQAAGMIPLLGIFISLAVTGALVAGLNQFFINVVRGEPATVADAFSGFKNGFWRYCGTYLTMALLILVCAIPAVTYAIIRSENDAFASDPVFWALAVAAFVVMVYLGVAFTFALYLVTDLQLSPWNSLQVSRRVVTRRWFSLFGLMILASLIAAAGLILCFIGIVLTLPFFYGIIAQAYEDIFGVQPATT
jgi:uncharacterized membrane protein